LDNKGEPKDKQRIYHAVQVLFHVGFIALLTLVVNAPLAPALMKKLGIIKDTENAKEIRQTMINRYDKA
jgi:hypothetical protein